MFESERELKAKAKEGTKTNKARKFEERKKIACGLARGAIPLA
jgi:hypothetical protein